MDRKTYQYACGLAVVLALGALAGCHVARNRVRYLVSAQMQQRLQMEQAAGGPLRGRMTGKPRTEDGREVTNTQIGGLSVSVWLPAPAFKGPTPLVIFSHGFHGSSMQSAFLMKALAEHGYLVIAPNHKDSSRNGGASRAEASFGNAASWSEQTYKDRAGDITSLLQNLKKDPAWSNTIDWTKVALAGHSLGGYTALGLAGGWPSWKLPEIKAVLALSPYCSPYVEKGRLNALTIPVMYQGGTRDLGVTLTVKRSGGRF